MVESLPDWIKKRAAGCLLHLTCLPSKTGIGNLGNSSYEFIDFLTDSGFSYWQTCPVGPTGYGDSPYQVFSSSAGNPYLIDWQPLVDKNLVELNDILELQGNSSNQVDYGNIYRNFFKSARKAFNSFLKDKSVFNDDYGNFENFFISNKEWLEPYATFQSFKKKFKCKPWWLWTKDHRKDYFKIQELDEFNFHVFLQYLFRGQWHKMKTYAHSRRISIIGDLPIYAAPDSSEVWSHPELFQLNTESNEFINVAGVPPDYFNVKGQYWGNPLYRWETHEKDNFTWWTDRLSEQLKLFDIVRIDHFRGFHDFWSIPAKTSDTKFGFWSSGPGINFWKWVRGKFPTLPFLAEDLGQISKEVRELRTQAGLPGMAVLQFAFDGDPENLYLPHNLSNSSVLYTGTHDNDTTMGWYHDSEEEIKSNFRSYLNVSGDDAAWDMLRFAYRSIAPLVIIPVQDLLSLGSEGRFNRPGSSQGNWQWRMTKSQLSMLHENSSSYLWDQAKITGRLPSSIH